VCIDFCSENERSTGQDNGVIPSTAMAMRRSSGASPPNSRHQPTRSHFDDKSPTRLTGWPGCRADAVGKSSGHAGLRYKLPADDGNTFLFAAQLKVGGREDVGAAAGEREDCLQSPRQQIVSGLLKAAHGWVAKGGQEENVLKKHDLYSARLGTRDSGVCGGQDCGKV
jgi:hypothetical protein